MKKLPLSFKYTHYVYILQRLYDFCLHTACNSYKEKTEIKHFLVPLDDQVMADNPVRLIDAFIKMLDLAKMGFANTVHKSEGRPPYAPGVLLLPPQVSCRRLAFSQRYLLGV